MQLFRSLAVALAVVLLATACDRAVEPYVPGEKPEQPDLSRIFPEGAERAAQQNAPQEGSGAGSPGMPAAPSAPPSANAASGGPVTGTIALAPGFERKVPAGAILFLVARKGGASGGPPLAVKRVEAPRFPLEFSLGPDDRMIETLPFEGPLQLSARLDADGNAMTRQPGDLQGQPAEMHQPGESGVAIVIDQVL
jgi:cytochrome c-type biogenesis protein CcmH